MILAALFASQVLVVDASGAGDHLELQPAIDASREGGVILVRPGTYERASIIAKSLRIVGEPDAGGVLPLLAPAPGPDPVFTIRDLGAGQRVHVRGLDMHHDVGAETVMLVEDNSGAIVLEDLLVRGFGFSPTTVHGAQIVDSSSVALIRCDVWGQSSDGTPTPVEAGGTGVQMYQSSLYLYDCDLRGGSGSDGFFSSGAAGGYGCDLGQGFLFSVGTRFAGGRGGDPDDSVFSADYGQGGGGLALGVGADAWLGGNDYFQTIEPNPGNPFQAHELATYIEFDHDPRAFEISSPHVEGELATLRYEGEVGEATITFFSPAPLGLAIPAPLAFVLPGQPLISLPTGSIPASGVLEFPVSVGSIGASPWRELFVQPVFVDAALTLRVASPSKLMIVNDGV